MLGGGCDTLLGPEGSGLFGLVSWWGPGGSHTAAVDPVGLVVGLVGAWCWGCRSYFENYTVDASIFVALSL